MKPIPTMIRDTLRNKLWHQCDELGWMSLPDTERARYYELWTRDDAIGGQLACMMDARRVRVYIKDSLVKPYVRSRLSLNQIEVWQMLGLTESDRPVRSYIKPHGRRLADGRIIGWGRSRDWKSVMMAVFERANAQRQFKSFGVVLLESGKTEGDAARSLVNEVGRRLSIERVVWLE